MLSGDEESLYLLRRFRDDVLLPHQQWNSYVNLLYENSDEIAALFLDNPFLTDRAQDFISEMLPRLRNSLRGEEISISSDEAEDIDLLLDQFETEASPRLKRAIRKAKGFFRKWGIEKQSGPIIIE
jgi:hypothetical protein